MRDRIQILQEKIDEIEGLVGASEWGAEYQIWRDRTERFIKEEYGDEAFNLLKKQNSVVLDDGAYLRELEGRKKILEGFIKHHNDYKPKTQKGIKVSSPRTISPLTVQGDFILGDKVGKDKNMNEPPSGLLERYWWGLLIPVIVVVLGFIVTEGRLPQFANLFTSNNELFVADENNSATTTPNLSSIFSKTNPMLDLEKENFLKDFEGGPVYAVGAVFDNINSLGEGFIVRMTVERNAVGCAFGAEFKKELQLLEKGDKINFYGIFTGSGLGGYGAVNPWYITDCSLLK